MLCAHALPSAPHPPDVEQQCRADLAAEKASRQVAQDSAAHVSNINAELEAELHELLQKQAQAAGSFRRMSDVKHALAEAQAQVDKLRSQEAKLREDMAEVEAQRSQLRAAGRADEASLLGYLSNLERQLSSACRAVVSGLCCRAVVVIISWEECDLAPLIQVGRAQCHE